MITPWHEGTPPKEITMTTRHRALAGAGLVLALALTGCNGTSEGAESTTTTAAPTTASTSQQIGRAHV